MCICIYAHVYTIHVCAGLYVHVHTYMCTRTGYVYVCVNMCAYTQACIYQAHSQTRVSHKLLQSCTRAGPGQNSRWDLGVRSNRMRW